MERQANRCFTHRGFTTVSIRFRRRLSCFGMLLFTFALHAETAEAAITFDSASQGGFGGTQSGSPNINWAHTVGSGTNRILIVGSTVITTAGTTPPTSASNGVTWTPTGGSSQTFTPIGTAVVINNVSTQLFMLVNPASGSGSISVRICFNPPGCSVTGAIIGGAVSYAGVDPANPTNGFGSNTCANLLHNQTCSVTVSSSTGSVVVGVASNNARMISGAGQTQLWNISTACPSCNPDDVFGTGFGSEKAGASSVTFTWTNFAPASTSTHMAIAAVSLNPFTPSDVHLDSFIATRYKDGRSLLSWHTGYEVDNLGFNLYREQSGERVRLNASPIAGSALMTGPGIALTAGRSYSWPDDDADDKEARYWLEEIALDGASSWHGPVSANRRDEGELPPGTGRPRLLAERAKDTAQTAHLFTKQLERRARPAQIAAEEINLQSGLAFGQALKLLVKEEGWYRVTQQELIRARLDPRVDPRRLRLFADGREVPISVRGEQDGRLDEQDEIEFYAVGIDAAFTDARAYWLVAGPRSGKRIAIAKTRSRAAAPRSFPYTVERRDRSVYFASLRNGEKENFFGAVVATEPVDQPLWVSHPDLTNAKPAQIEIALEGVTLAAHRVKVLLNESELGEISFKGQQQGKATFLFPQSQLKQDENRVRLIAQAGPNDVSLVDYIRLTYQHTFTADDNWLRLIAAGKQRVTVNGFTSAEVRVLDVTDAEEVRELAGNIQADGADFSVTFDTPKGARRTLLVFAKDRAKPPTVVASRAPSELKRASNRADMLIVSHRDFIKSVEPLRQLRQQEGLEVLVADVEDVFDEFSFGNKSPHAIKDLLLYAKTKWERAPRFVLLVGDASLDPKGYLERGDFDFVPTRLIDTDLMETASDCWFADFNDDGVGQMAVGRFPARTPHEADLMVSKTINYERNGSSGPVLLVSDGNDTFNFGATSRRLRDLVPSDIAVEEVDLNQIDTTTAKAMLIENLNRGPRLVNYFGHGSVDLWKGSILTGPDAKNLTNRESLSVFATMTCLNGYFQEPSLESLAESLMRASEGGAVAVWASSGMTSPATQAEANRELFRQLFKDDRETLGKAISKAKAAARSADVRRTYILFGDPALKLR